MVPGRATSVQIPSDIESPPVLSPLDRREATVGDVIPLPPGLPKTWSVAGASENQALSAASFAANTERRVAMCRPKLHDESAVRRQ